MFRKYKINAFSLPEILITLTIIGIIATLTVPGVVVKSQNKISAQKLKDFATSIQTLANNQKVKYRTTDLSQTDFSSAEKLLTSSNFNAAKICHKDDASDCWEKGLVYKRINGQSDSNNTKLQHPTLNGEDPTIILSKNGTTIRYVRKNTTSASEQVVGYFMFDLNGNKKPNIIGRDYFEFSITKDGRITPYKSRGKNDSLYPTEADPAISGKSYCTDSAKVEKPNENYAGYCYWRILSNNWEMPED